MTTRTLDHLRRGARIHSVLYASFIARNTDRQYDVVWEGLGYRRTTKAGATGIVVFSKSGAVGAFFEPESPRNPKTAKKKTPLGDHVKGIPTALGNVAKRETFPAMALDTADPAVTAVFWSDPKGALVGARPWDDLLADGAYLVEPETQAPDACIATLGETYGIDEARLAVVRDERSAAKQSFVEPRVVLLVAGPLEGKPTTLVREAKVTTHGKSQDSSLDLKG